MSEQAHLLGLFREELEGALPRLQELVLALEARTGGRAEGQEAMRVAHSLKGAARIVGSAHLAGALHAAEDALAVTTRGEPLDGDDAQRLLTLVDALEEASALAPSELGRWFEARQGQLAEIEAALRRTVRVTPAMRGGKGSGGKTGALETSLQSSLGGGAEATFHEDARAVRVPAESLTRLLGAAGSVVVEARRFGTNQRAAFSLARAQARLEERTAELLRAAARDGEQSLLSLAATLAQEAAEARRLSDEILEGHADAALRLTDASEHLFIEALRVRQRPFSELVPALRRRVRDNARALNKSARLEVSGAATLVDGDVLAGLEPVLGHLVTNAVDHGIEPEAERKAGDKPAQGLVAIDVQRVRADLLVTVRDDGRGIDGKRVVESALARGLIERSAVGVMPPSEVLELLFLPGFSLAQSLSQLSGRGVGLDAVRTAIRRLGGRTRISSEPGRGTRFELTLPITRVVVRALLVEVAGECYALPLAKIGRVVRVSPREVRSAEGRSYVELDGANLGLVRADELLGLVADEERPPTAELTLVVLGRDKTHFGLVVDRSLGEDDLVVQALDPRLGHLPDVAAGALLADGSPTLVLDADDVVLSIERLSRRRRPMAALVRTRVASMKRVLVVDNSAVVRETERVAVAREGYAVATACDGSEAWDMLQAQHFDLLVTDVEMPRLDGVELVERVRADVRFASLPVIMISYRDGDAERARGLAAGAQHFLSKNQFEDKRLVALVRELIGRA